MVSFMDFYCDREYHKQYANDHDHES